MHDQWSLNLLSTPRLAFLPDMGDQRRGLLALTRNYSYRNAQTEFSNDSEGAEPLFMEQLAISFSLAVLIYFIRGVDGD